MTLSDINTKISALTGQDTTSYPNSQRAIDISLWQDRLVAVILQSTDDSGFDDPRYGNLPVMNAQLIANQRVYPFAVSDNVLEYRRVDVTYDGVNWYRATPLDDTTPLFSLGDGTTASAEANVDTYFTQQSPRYDIEGGFNLKLYPMPTATTGTVSVRVSRTAKAFTASDLSTGTAEPGFDRNFHYLLAYGPAWEFASAHQLPNKDDILAVLEDGKSRLAAQHGRKQADAKDSIRPLQTFSDFR